MLALHVDWHHVTDVTDLTLTVKQRKVRTRCNYMYVSHLEIASNDVRRDMSTKSSRKTYLQQVINRSRTKDSSVNSEIK